VSGAKKLVEAVTLEQKIAQLHGTMETIDIYAITAQAAESGADMAQLPKRSLGRAQYGPPRVKRS
jgi:hypothetical protein